MPDDPRRGPPSQRLARHFLASAWPQQSDCRSALLPRGELMPDDLPDDPMSELAGAAHQMHELFVAYVAAGFTDEQAMSIILALLTATIQREN